MTNLTEVADALQQVLAATPAAQARASVFCQRRSKLSAAVFVRTLVLGWLANLAAALAELTTVAAALRRGLALWVYGTILAGSACQTAVLLALRPVFGLTAQHAPRRAARRWASSARSARDRRADHQAASRVIPPPGSRAGARDDCPDPRNGGADSVV